MSSTFSLPPFQQRNRRGSNTTENTSYSNNNNNNNEPSGSNNPRSTSVTPSNNNNNQQQQQSPNAFLLPSSASLLQDDGLRALLIQEGVSLHHHTHNQHQHQHQHAPNRVSPSQQQQQKRNAINTRTPPHTPKSMASDQSLGLLSNNIQQQNNNTNNNNNNNVETGSVGSQQSGGRQSISNQQQQQHLNHIHSTIASSNNVTVAVRVRPLSSIEKLNDPRVCVEFRGEHTVNVPKLDNINKIYNSSKITNEEVEKEDGQKQQKGGGSAETITTTDRENSSTSISNNNNNNSDTNQIKIHTQVMLTCGSNLQSSSTALLSDATSASQQSITTGDNINKDSSTTVASASSPTPNLDSRRYNFGFQAVFDEQSKQEDIYSGIAYPLIETVLSGFNSVIFAYGQTGAGKTFTMSGDLPPVIDTKSTNTDKYNSINNIKSKVDSGNTKKKQQQQSLTTDGQYPAQRGSAQQQQNDINKNKHVDPVVVSSTSAAEDGGAVDVDDTAAELVDEQQQQEQPETQKQDLRGIIPRAATHIFDSLYKMYPPSSNDDTIISISEEEKNSYSNKHLHHHNTNHHNTKQQYAVVLSFVEIHLDKVRDLIEPSRVNLPIREKDGVFFVDGCSEHYVKDTADILKFVEKGTKSRATSASKMNDRSSRSHSVLTISIHRRLGEGQATCGRLQLVDLAGSERVGKSGTQVQTAQFEEACAINKSLSHLSEVITAILDNRHHIPYRSCALTKLLSASLGGNAKTAVIICCSPSTYNEQETLSSLRFGSSVSGIKNKATMNRLVTEEQMRRYVAKLWNVIRILEKENDTVKGQLQLVSQASSDPEALAVILQQIVSQQQQQQYHSSSGLISPFNQAGASSTSLLLLQSQNSIPGPSPMTVFNQTANTLMNNTTNTNNNNNNDTNATTVTSSSNVLSSNSATPDALAVQFMQHIARFARPLSTTTQHEGSQSQSFSNNNLRPSASDESMNNNNQNNNNNNNFFNNTRTTVRSSTSPQRNMSTSNNNDASSSSPDNAIMQTIFGARAANSPAGQSFGNDMQYLLARSSQQQQQQQQNHHNLHNNSGDTAAGGSGGEALLLSRTNNDLTRSISQMERERQRQERHQEQLQQGGLLTLVQQNTHHDDDPNHQSSSSGENSQGVHSNNNMASSIPLMSPLMPQGSPVRSFTTHPILAESAQTQQQQLSDSQNNNNNNNSENLNESQQQQNQRDATHQHHQDEDPLTSREFSPAASPPQNITSNNQTNNNNNNNSNNNEEEETATQLRYISLLKEMSDALKLAENDREDAQAILKNIEEQKLREKSLIFEKEHQEGNDWAIRERRLAEKLQRSEEQKEALTMNLSMMNFSIKESERNRVKALRHLESQSFEISNLVTELERTKVSLRNVQSNEESLKSKYEELEQRLQSNEKWIPEENKKLDVEKQQQQQAAEEEARRGAKAKKTSERKIQTEVQMSDIRENDPLASFTIEPLNFEDLVRSNTAKKQQQQQQLMNNSRNSSTSNNNSPSNSNKKEQLKAAEAYLDRAISAERRLTETNTTLTRIRQEQEETEQQNQSLKRQMAVMEQRLIALRKITDANGNTIVSPQISDRSLSSQQYHPGSPMANNSNNNNITDSRLAALRAARRTNSVNNNAAAAGGDGSPSHQQGVNIVDQTNDNSTNQPDYVSSTSEGSAALERLQLQQRTKSMETAAERLQQETKRFGK